MAIFQQRVGFTQDLWSSITANVSSGALNDVSTDNLSTIRFTNATSISGFDNPYDGKQIEIINGNTSDLEILNENSGSLAANRIVCPDGNDVLLPSNGSLRFRYSSTSSRWHVVGGAGGGSGSGQRNYLEKWFKAISEPGVMTGIAENANVTTDVWHSSTGPLFTLSKTTVSPLREKTSYISGANTSASTGGTVFFQTPRFRVDLADVNKAVLISFDSEYSAGDWDVVVIRYDSSGVFQERLPVSGITSPSTLVPSALISTNISKFVGYFVTSNNSLDYYSVRFRRLTGSSQLKLDTLYCGPDNFSKTIFSDLPVGTVVPYAGTALPPGWLFCDGAAYSSSAYPALFAVIGTTHGSPGSGLFNVPDYRGRFMRGVDGTAGRDPNAATRTAMNAGGNTGNNVGSVQLGASSVTLSGSTTFASSTHKHLSTTGQFSGTQYLNPVFGTAASPGGPAVYTFSGLGGPFASSGMTGHLTDTPDSTASVSLLNGGGSEHRPLNAYVNYIIKARSNNGLLSIDITREEYSFNTTTTVATDTTSFGYGSSGGQIPSGVAAGSFTKRVNFTTPILSSDKIALELSFDSGQTWTEVLGGDGALEIPGFQTQNTETYGIGLAPVSSTSVDVRFGRYQRPSGATYGSAGTNWSGTAAHRYRVRKIANGATASPPISITNITDGRAQANTEAYGFSNNIANGAYGTTTNNVTETLSKPTASGKILVTATLTYRYVNSNGTPMQTGIRMTVLEGSTTLYDTPFDTITVPTGFDGYLTRSISFIVTSTNSTAYTVRASEYNAGGGVYSATAATLSTSASLVRV